MNLKLTEWFFFALTLVRNGSHVIFVFVNAKGEHSNRCGRKTACNVNVFSFFFTRWIGEMLFTLRVVYC